MAKVIRNVDKDQQEFIKIVDTLANRFHRWEIWSDFIIMFAISISNSIDKVHAEQREEIYMRTVKKYTQQELELFPQLCAMVVMALENDKNRDFLGEMYMALNLGNHWKGQFFTPYNVCRMMAEITCGDTVSEIEEKGYIAVNDCCCGAGALLIAYANAAEQATINSGYNWQNHLLFTAQDVDMVVGLMCYIQLSLIGCAGFVKIGNSLTEPMTEGEAIRDLSNPNSYYWYTPMYFSDVWQYRRVFHMLDMLTSPPVQAKSTDNAENSDDNQTDDNAREQKKTDISAKNSPNLLNQSEFIEENNGQLSLF